MVQRSIPRTTASTTLVMNSIKALLVDTTIWVLYRVFLLLELLLSFPSQLWSVVFELTKRGDRSHTKATVIIVGANFAGLTALQKLSKHANKFRIILMDQRDYFEFTPGVLRLFCEPEHYDNLAKNLSRQGSPSHEFIHGRVTSIVGDENDGSWQKVLTYQPVISKGGGTVSMESRHKTLKYDYLILATGATYPSPIWPNQNELTLNNRRQGWKKVHKDLLGAHRILVLGAGAVGVELAAEIVDHYGDSKTVTLVDAGRSLTPMFPRPVSNYARAWFERRRVQLRLGQKLASWNDTSCTFLDGTTIQADVVYNCMGSRPNSDAFNRASKQRTLNGNNFVFTKGRHVVVGNTLQVQRGPMNYGSIFAVGDVAMPPGGGEKQAFQAEIQGKVAAYNVVALASSKDAPHSKKLLRYPQDMSGSDQMPMIFALSLGRYDGIVAFNDLCIPGPLCPIVKWILEYTKVLQMQGRPLGIFIWKVADDITLFLSSTLIKRSPSTKKTI